MVLYCVLQFAGTVTGRLAVPSAIHASEARGPNMGPQVGALLRAPKIGHQYTIAETVLAPNVQHLKQEFLKNASCKPLFSLGFMLDGSVVLCAAATPVMCPLIPVCSKFLLGLPAAKPIESQIPVFGPVGDTCRVRHTHYC